MGVFVDEREKYRHIILNYNFPRKICVLGFYVKRERVKSHAQFTSEVTVILIQLFLNPIDSPTEL